MPISANTLFHFTSTKKNLKGILQGAFVPRYVAEDLSSVLPDKGYLVNVPMVCFCDIPLSQISEHIKSYGSYGIGLEKKTWGQRKGISPVLYVSKESETAKLMAKVVRLVNPSVDEQASIFPQLLNFCKYIKAYEGIPTRPKTYKRRLKSSRRRKRETKPRIYYHEREWRYSPLDAPVLTDREPKRSVERANREISKRNRLAFEATDVKYIIVPTEHDIPALVDFIEKQSPFNPEHLKILVTKIISAEQIRMDM